MSPPVRDSALPPAAMVLAAGIGARMQPLTERRPKPLIEVMGRPLIDHVLDRLALAGVTKAIINVHHFADMLEAHLKVRKRPAVTISDERGGLLGTGGGIARALPLLGSAPFLLLNSDSLWIEGKSTPNIVQLARAFNGTRMQVLLLLAPKDNTIGYEGSGDYRMDAEGRLYRHGERQAAPYIYAGAAILSPAMFSGAPDGAFPLPLLFDRAEAAGRLFGLKLEGTFLHVGTPAAIVAAEEAMRRSMV